MGHYAAYSQASYSIPAAAPTQPYYSYGYDQSGPAPTASYSDGAAPAYMHGQQQHYGAAPGSGSNSPYMISPTMNGAEGEASGSTGRAYPPSPPLDVEAPYINPAGGMTASAEPARVGRPKASKSRKPSSNYADSAEEDSLSPTLEPTTPANPSRSLSSQKRKGLLTTRACDECRAVKRKCVCERCLTDLNAIRCKREEGSSVCDSCAKANRRCTFSSTSSTTAKRQCVASVRDRPR